MRTLVAAAAACLALAGLSHADDTQASIKKYQIEAQPISTALKAFAAQSDMQLIYTESDVGQAQTHGVNGDLKPRDALTTILRGTDLEFEFTANNVIVVRKPESRAIARTTSLSSSLSTLGEKSSQTGEGLNPSPRERRGAGVRLAQNEQEQKTNPQPSDTKDENKISEVIVTARKREEKLQDVPDAVSVLTGTQLESAGITSVPEFMRQIPNLTFQDGSSFRAGSTFMTLRGIGNAEGGWAPVTYIVDGVPADSLSALNSGTLVDVERIEVLRGPQSALYGAGAIAGAINVITRPPTDTLQLRTKATYAKGDDKRIVANASGPIVEDQLYFGLNGYYRDSDGLIKSGSNGIHLDFAEHKQFRGRLIYRPTETIELDLRAEYLEELNGSTYQSKFPRSAANDPSVLDDWGDSTLPRRRKPGTDDREFTRFTLSVNWDFEGAVLSSVTGYSDTTERLLVSTCWDDPSSPAVDANPNSPGAQAGCIFNPSLGSSAASGQYIDNHYDGIEEKETWTQDVRIASSGDTKLRWVTGLQLLQRDALAGFDLGVVVAPDESFLPLSSRHDLREDFWWGVYGQLAYDLTERLELTVAARYDDNTYENTRFSDRRKSVVIPSTTASAAIVNTRKEDVTRFQPKVQLAYEWRDDGMVYLTWAEGFRAGFFNSGNFTEPEHTTNYEAGVKASWLDNRLITNAAFFHIDYSKQQTGNQLATPPFVIYVAVPETDIDGAEFEAIWRATAGLTLTGSVGYVNSRIVGSGGVRPPYTSDWTATASADFVQPVTGDWDVHLYGGYRYHSDLYLRINLNPLFDDPISRVSPKHFLDLRAALASPEWEVALFMKNALDTREAVRTLADQGANIGGILRGPNQPRSYGVEVSYAF